MGIINNLGYIMWGLRFFGTAGIITCIFLCPGRSGKIGWATALLYDVHYLLDQI